MNRKLIILSSSAIFGILCLLLSCEGRSTNYLYEKPKDNTKENLIRANRYLVHQDSLAIYSYAQRHKWNMQCSSTGLWYEITQTSKETKAQSGMQATISYRVELLDGTYCYSSDSLGLKSVQIGQGSVEKGLEQGLLLMHQGETARFILPPHLAWGLAGDGNRIGARNTLVYQVKLLKLDVVSNNQRSK